MQITLMTCRQYREASKMYRKANNKSFLSDNIVKCDYSGRPWYHERFGELIVISKDFYAGVPDINEIDYDPEVTNLREVFKCFF